MNIWHYGYWTLAHTGSNNFLYYKGHLSLPNEQTNYVGWQYWINGKPVKVWWRWRDPTMPRDWFLAK